MWSPTAWSSSDEVVLPMRVEFVCPPVPANGDPFNGALPMKVELPSRPCAPPGLDAGGGGVLDGGLPLKVRPPVANCDTTSGSASDTPDVDTDEEVSESWSSADDLSSASPLLVSLDRALEAAPAARTRLRSQAAMYVPAAGPLPAECRFAPLGMPGSKQAPKGGAAVMAPIGERTTVMLCNLPSSYTSDKLVVFLDLHGYSEQFDLVYVPINFKSMTCVGYSFVNFTTHEHATRFMHAFEGFDDWGSPSKSPCTVCWSDVQGLDRNVCHYQNSPVMCESVPDSCKPILLKDGAQISFPKPTKQLRALKCRRGIAGRN